LGIGQRSRAPGGTGRFWELAAPRAEFFCPESQLTRVAGSPVPLGVRNRSRQHCADALAVGGAPDRPRLSAHLRSCDRDGQETVPQQGTILDSVALMLRPLKVGLRKKNLAAGFPDCRPSVEVTKRRGYL